MRLNFFRGKEGEVAGMFFWMLFFLKKAALGDVDLIDSFLEHLINFYQQHFSFACVF